MESVEIKADELSPAQRAVIEELLGCRVTTFDTIAVRSFPTEERERARNALMAYLERRAAQPADTHEPFPEEVFTEAMRSVRARFRTIP
jgi:hypothetical protein